MFERSFFRLASAFALAFTATSCASAEGTEPHDMSAAGHEAAAGAEETAAAEHEAQYDSAAQGERVQCGVGHARVCWTSTVNPTEPHSEEAARHLELAAQHRAASEALRNAEASACAGIAEEDRAESPFAHREDIRSVSELEEERRSGRQTRDVLVGATVEFRAVPELTEEWLQRLVDCHLARNASLGHQIEGMDYCPLVPAGVQADVRSVGDGFAIDVRSDDPQTAREVLRRAKALTGASS